MITIKKGLDIPLKGNPDQVIHADVTINEVAIVGSSFIEFKPTLKVREGDKVIKGQELCVDKHFPTISFVSPVSGTIKQINRGERRVFQSLVIVVDHDSTETVEYTVPTLDQSQACKDLLLKSGLWTGFRTRPYNKTADPNFTPYSIFVNAHDTNPGCANPDIIIAEDAEAFELGLKVIASVFKDVKNKYVVSGPKSSLKQVECFTFEQFKGPHPAGLVGTHMNFLCPVSLHRYAYHINYADVIQIGKLFKTGKYDGTKVVALSGPQVKQPTLFRIPYGASVEDLTKGRLLESTAGNRIISGSCLDGIQASGEFAYVGQYDLQVSVLEEGTNQEFLGWVLPQPKKFSLSRLSYFGKHNLALTTSTNGSERSNVPLGMYERVMPLDIYPTLLLRDIISGDTDSAQDLGVLELAEEDLALCSFVCQGKYDYALYLRRALHKIEKEG